MKYLLFFLLLATKDVPEYIRAQGPPVVTSNLFINGKSITSLSTDSTLNSVSDNMIVSAKALKDYITNNSGTPNRVEVYSGNTDGSGNYSITFTDSFTVVPGISTSVINNSTTNRFIRVTSISRTAFTVNVYQRNSITILGAEVLLSATSTVSGASVNVVIQESD